MKLSDILGDIEYEVVWGDIEVPIDCISYHSDKMKQDSLFVCVEGSKHDGHDYIAQAVMKGCRAIIVEKKVALEFIPSGCTVVQVNLELHRVDSCDFTVGIFTNLYPEHLDDHVTFERYKEAKLKLFSLAPLSIINADDAHAEDFIQASKGDCQTYGIENLDADWVAKDVSVQVNGVTFSLVGHDVHTEVTIPITGHFTVYNALAAISTCLSLDVPLQTILDALKEIKGPDGRLQTIQSPDGYTIMVDYAHTPDALDNVLSNLKPYTAGKLILVFGCGGDRDGAKRPRMGEIASKWCDHIILTSDNPRTENPMSIIKDIEKGIGMIKEYDIIEDREKAIQYAMKNAEKEDIILIAGKGNETNQIVGEEKLPFSDVQVVKENM